MAILEEIGTWHWAKRTGGKLSTAECEALLQQAAAMMQSLMNAEPESNAAKRQAVARIDAAKVIVPDSHTARQAEALIAELCQPALANHCYRTYLWGSLLAQRDAVPVPDVEAFYVASLLHDLGLTEHHFCRHEGAHCFAVEGALAAEQFLTEQGWEQTRREVVAEAIALHLNMLVELAHGPVAHYLSAGAKCDVMGMRACDLPNEFIEDGLRRYSGLGFAESFGQLLGREVRQHPAGRIAFVGENFPTGELFPIGNLAPAV